MIGASLGRLGEPDPGGSYGESRGSSNGRLAAFTAAQPLACGSGSIVGGLVIPAAGGGGANPIGWSDASDERQLDNVEGGGSDSEGL